MRKTLRLSLASKSGLYERAKRRLAHPFKKQTRKGGAPSVVKLRVLHPPTARRQYHSRCLFRGERLDGALISSPGGIHVGSRHPTPVRYTLLMLMVIFGAGASFDSSSTYTPGIEPPGAASQRDDAYHRPPLAKDLFANRPLFIKAVDDFPECKTIVGRLRDPAVTSGQASIEARLQEIEEEAKTYDRGPIELAAVRRYLQRAISECEIRWRANTKGITNQLSLLREIERLKKPDEPVCLVTFNYDTLLEGALADLELGIKEMDYYTRRPTLFRLFKLHGSVNWGRVLENRFPSTELQPSDQFVLCDPTTMRSPDIGHTLFPAIAIPVEKKQLFECPGYMVDDLKKLLPHVTKIIVVGWRAMETYFLDLLKQHLKRGVYLTVVAAEQKEADDIRVRINRALPNNQPSSTCEAAAGFTIFMRSGRLQAILAS